MAYYYNIRAEYLFAYISNNNEPHFCFYVNIKDMTVLYFRKCNYNIRNKINIQNNMWITFIAEESLYEHNIGISYIEEQLHMEERLYNIGITRQRFEKDIVRVIGI